MVRDLEYDWQTLVENLQIPVTFRLLITAYKGDRDQATPMPIEIVQSAPNLIEAIVHRRFPGTITFEPLAAWSMRAQVWDSNNLDLLPTVCQCLQVRSELSLSFLEILPNTSSHPRWWNHISERNEVLDGDMMLLSKSIFYSKETD